MAAQVPDIACSIFISKKKIKIAKNEASFIREKCCHLTLCLRLTESHYLLLGLLVGLLEGGAPLMECLEIAPGLVDLVSGNQFVTVWCAYCVILVSKMKCLEFPTP